MRSQLIKSIRSSRFRPRCVVLEDRNLMSVFTVINTSDSGSGSLRQAIVDANAHANSGGRDEIQFAIPGSGVHTIQPTSSLPAVTDTVVIDGYTQAGSRA